MIRKYDGAFMDASRRFSARPAALSPRRSTRYRRFAVTGLLPPPAPFTRQRRQARDASLARSMEPRHHPQARRNNARITIARR
jgi:hypothetical protein